MQLFEIKNDIVSFADETYLLKPFSAIIDRDKSKGKTIAKAELAAVFFFSDYKSDFSTILDEDEKLKLVKSYIIGMAEDWKPDKLFYDAVEFYKERQKTLSIKLLESARKGVDKISKYLENVDLDKVDKQGKLLFNAKQFSDTIKGAGDMTESLTKLEDQVKKEIQEKKNNFGSRNKNTFEDDLE